MIAQNTFIFFFISQKLLSPSSNGPTGTTRLVAALSLIYTALFFYPAPAFHVVIIIFVFLFRR